MSAATVGMILVIAGVVIAAVDGVIVASNRTAPTWLLNVAGVLIGVGVLLGAKTLTNGA